MTDKLDLSEEIAVLRRALAGQSVMLKRAVDEIDRLGATMQRPHDTLDALKRDQRAHELRLQMLEKWQLEISEWQRVRSVPVPPPPPSPPWTPMPHANDNNPADCTTKAPAPKLYLHVKISGALPPGWRVTVADDILN